MKKSKRTEEQRNAIAIRKAARKNAKGTYYKEVRNEAKKEKDQNNFKIMYKRKAMRLIAGVAYTKYSKFFQEGILKLATEYVGR